MIEGHVRIKGLAVIGNIGCYSLQGFLAKIYENSGEGVAAFTAIGSSLVLGSSGFASKSSYFKIPLVKPRGFKVSTSILALSITTPPTVVTPFRWKIELENSTISREAKPQFSVQLEDSTLHKILYDVKPVLAGKGENVAVDGYTVRAFYDSAHPIAFRELSLFNVYSKPGVEHSAVYLTGALALEPGDSYTTTLRFPKSVKGGDKILVLTLISPSPRVTLNISTKGDNMEVSGHGFKIVELQPLSEDNIEVFIEYPKPEISIYPKRVLISNIALMENKIPVPPLRVEAEKIDITDGKLKIKLTITNEGKETAEDVQVALRHAMINLKEVRIGSLKPGEIADIVLELDTSRLPTAAQRITVRVSWAKNGIVSSKSIALDIR